MNKKLKKIKGFTILELMIVITIFAIIFSTTSIALGDLVNKNSLNSEVHKLVQVIREVRMSAVSQQDNSKWGINLVNSTDPDRYILFKGESYGARDPSSDITFVLPNNIMIVNIALGGGNEIVFTERSGYTNNGGSFALANDNDQINFIINDLGLVDYY